MDWNTVEVSERHRQALGQYEVAYALKGEIPWVEQPVTVFYTDERPLDVLEQFVIRCLVELEPVEDVSEVCDVLGLKGERFVDPIVSELDRMQLLNTDESGYHPTDELREANQKGVWVDQHTRDLKITANPFTGQRFASRPSYLEEGGGAPSEGFPGEELRDEAILEWMTAEAGPFAGADISKIERGPYTVLRQPFQVVVFEDHHESAWGWEPYDPVEEETAVAYRSACESLQATEAAREALSEGSAEEEIVAVAEEGEPAQGLTTNDLPDRNLQEAEFVRRYGTTEAAKQINESIARAREEILITFPWIKGPALTNDLISAMEAALDNGAFLYIGYGISESRVQEDSHPDAIERIRSLDRKTEGNSVVVWTGESHVKEIVIDRSEYLGGSFNRLSFRGDASRRTGNVRRESMIHTNCPEVVDTSIHEFVPILQDAMSREIGEPKFDSYSAWRKSWQALFRLGPRTGDIATALATFPSQGRKTVDAIELILNSFRSGGRPKPESVLQAVLQNIDSKSLKGMSDTAWEDFEEVFEQFRSDWEIEEEIGALMG